MSTSHSDKFAADNLPPKETWPQFTEINYKGLLNCGAAILDGAIRRGWGSRTLFLSETGNITYGEFLKLTNKIAHVLVNDCKLVPGNRVLLRGANTPTLAAIWFAVVKAGGICVTTMPLLRAKELSYIIEKAQIGLCLCESTLLEEIKEVQKAPGTLKQVLSYGGQSGEIESAAKKYPDSFNNIDTDANDVALIAFTSGTTGKAKATMHFHRDVMAICDAFPISTLRASMDDVFTGSPPLGFTFGLGATLLFPMCVGASIVYPTKSSPEEMMAAIARYKATVCFSSPTGYRAMSEFVDKYKVTTLRKCVSAGETLPEATFNLWRKATGIKLIDGIGATEMLHIFISADEDHMRPGWTGKAIPGYQACILSKEGNELPPGEVGYLAVRGPTGCRYLSDPERQKEYVKFGWNITGDAYVMSEDGYFQFHARADDMIISSGYNISGIEVENVLLTHPKVKECAVVGTPCPERGMIVKAFVVMKETPSDITASVKELQEFVKSEIAPYKYPRAIEFVTALPRTETGKLQRFRLRG